MQDEIGKAAGIVSKKGENLTQGKLGINYFLQSS
jgi:hypothetical protein